MTRRRAIFIALFAIPVFLGLALYVFAGSKMAFDLALKAAKSAGFDIQVAKISGNLLSGLNLKDAQVRSAFVNGKAKVAQVKYPLWQLLTKRDLRLDVALEGAEVEFDPLKLPPVDANVAAPPVNVFLERASVQDVRLKLRGKFVEIPNVTARILEQHDTSEKNLSGTVKLALETVTGSGTANVNYSISKDWVFNFIADADLDARIARYWYKDIKSGRVLAHYNLLGDKLSGYGEVKDGVLEPIPGIVVSNVNGSIIQDTKGFISGILKGTALDGPLELGIGVNTVFNTENISVTGWAEPKLQPALRAFKADLPASGKVRVTVSGGGWEKLEFKGKLAGDGRVLGFPLEKITGDWVFNSSGDTLKANVLANSRLLNAEVKAKANLNFKLLENLAVVNASVTGEKILGAPLEATGQLTLKDESLAYTLESNILNGQVKANGDLKSGKTITGSGTFSNLRVSIPFENLVSGAFTLSGTNTDIRVLGTSTQNLIKIPAVKSSSFPGKFALRVKDGSFSGTAQLGEFSWNGDLRRGVVSLNNLQLVPAGVVSASANYNLQGSNGTLTGKLEAFGLSYQGVTLEDASGPFTLEIGKRLNGYWNANQLEGFLQADRVRIKPRNWLVTYLGQPARLLGDAAYLFNGNLEGQVKASTKFGVIVATGQGKNIALGGNLKYSPLPGKTISALAKGSLQLEPFKLQTTANISSSPNVLSGKVYANLGSSLQAGGEIFTAGGRKLNLKFENGKLNSSGEMNLSAVDAVLPKSAQGQISGVAKLEFVNTNGTGKLSAKAFGIPILAVVQVKNNLVSTNANVTGSLLKGATATGQVFPNINALLTYGSIRARVTGKTDNLTFNAFGTLPSKPQLEQLGLGAEIKKLGLDWNPEVIAIKGFFKQNNIIASGKIGKLEIKSGQYNLMTQAFQAAWRGSFSARYQNKPIILTNSTGQVNSSKLGATFNVVADKLEGEFQNQRVNALGLKARGSISSRATNFDITARSVDAKLQGQVLNAQNLDARGSIVANGKVNLNVNADQLNANLQGQKVKASNLKVQAVISSGTKFDVHLKATSLDADVQGQQIKASNITALANSNGQLQGKLAAESLVGNLAGTAFDLQGIDASAVPVNGKLEVAAKVKTGTMNLQNNPVHVRNLEANAIINTTNIAKLASVNFKANLKATNADGKLEGIGAKTQNLNVSVVRTDSSLTGSITTGAASVSGKDWQLETSSLTANNLKYNLEKPASFGADARISSATGTYQKNPFKLENTFVSLDSSVNGLGFGLNSAALEGSFEGYQINSSQLLASGKLEGDLLVFDAQSGQVKASKNTSQLETQELELTGQYDLKRGNASISKFKLSEVMGNLGRNTLNAQALEGTAGLSNATSGKLEDALLRGRVSGKAVNGSFEGEEFKLETFKADAQKNAQKYLGQLEATRAMGGWQGISANLEQFKLNATLENQRLTGNISGSRASGIYQNISASFEKFKLNGEMNGSKISGQVTASRGSGSFQNETANLTSLNWQATSEDGLIQTHLEAASGSGKFQNANANVERFKLNAKLKNDDITADLEGTRATGAFQEARGKLEQFKLNAKRLDQIWSGDLEANTGSGSYLDGRGNLEQFKLSARLNGKVLTGALKAQHANGNWQEISGKLEQLQLTGELNENIFKTDLTAANGSGKTRDANANLEKLKLEAQVIQDQIFGTLEASRGIGTYQKAKAELNNFKIKGRLADKLFNANLEAQNGTGNYQDVSAKLEQFFLNAQVIDGLVTGDLTGTRGSGAYKDGIANFEHFNLNAQLAGNKLRGKLEALTGEGVWQDVSAKLERLSLSAETVGQKLSGTLAAQTGNGTWQDLKLKLQDFNAFGTLDNKNAVGEISAALGSGTYQGTDVKLEQVKASADMVGKRIAGTLEANIGQAVRRGSSLNLAGFKSEASFEGTRVSVNLNANHGEGKTEDFNALLKDFNLGNTRETQNIISRFAKTPMLLMVKQNTSSVTTANLDLENLKANLEMQGKILNGKLQASSGAGAMGDNALIAKTFLASAKINGSNLDSSFQGQLGGKLEQQVFQSNLNATLGLNLEHVMDQAWRGQIVAETSGQSPKNEHWKLEAHGPWNTLIVNGKAPSGFLAGWANTTLLKELETLVNLDGLVSLPKLEFNGLAQADLGTGANAINLQARVKGNPKTWNVNANLTDAQGGTARASFDSALTGKVSLERFDLALFTGRESLVSGNVQLENQRLKGVLSSEFAGLPIQANWLEDGSFNANVGGVFPLEVKAASWKFPFEVRALSVESGKSEFPIEVAAVSKLELGAKSGQLLEATGTLRILNYSQSVPGGSVNLKPTELQFSASYGKVLGIRVTRAFDALVFDGQGWNGGLSFPYSAWDQAGMVRVDVLGDLTDPNLKLESSGVLNLKANANLRQFSARGDLDLTGAAQALPANISKTVQPGRLRFDASGKLGQQLEVNASLSSENAKVDGDAVRLSAQAKLEGQTWSVAGDAGLGQDSSSSFQMDNSGFVADQLDLDLRLLRIVGIAANGRVTGDVQLPEFKLEAGTANLKLENLKAFDVTANGTAQLEAGQLNAQLEGILPGKYNFSLDGGFYPQANAAFSLEGLRGRIAGDASENSRNLKLTASGSLFEKITRLEASLMGSKISANASWDAATATAVADLDSSGVTGTGHAEISSLAGLEKIIGRKLEGNLQTDLEFQNLDVTAPNLKGTVEGVKLNGALQYKNAQLEAQKLKLEYQNLAAEVNGKLYPNLNADFTGNSKFDFAPAKFSGSATGTFERPDVTATALLGTARLGLIAPGTMLKAGFDGKRFNINLSGDAVLGLVEGNFDGLEQVNLRFKKALAQYQDSKLELDGTLSWSKDRGFGGDLTSSGTFLGEAAKLNLVGRDDLAVALNWRSGRLNALLPARVSKDLNATLELERFDIGALWRKPGQLTLAAKGEAHGSWTQPSLSLIGKLDDAKDDLDANLDASYLNGLIAAKLEGPKIQVNGTFNNSKWQANGAFQNVQLEPLLPFSVGTLEVSGVATANDAGQGIEASLSNLNATGELERVGAFSLQGNAQYAQDKATANLNAKLLSGNLSLNGALDSSLKSDGIDAKLTNINLESFGVQGTVDGALKLFGNASDPEILGDLNLKNFRLGSNDDWFVNALVFASGKLLNPVLEANTTLSGSGSGNLKISARDLLKATHIGVSGQAKLLGVEFEGALEGIYPKLLGTADVHVSSLPKNFSSFKLHGSGDGLYQVSLENTLRGSIKLEESPDLFNPQLSGDLELDLELQSVTESASGRVSGQANLTGSVFKPNLSFSGDLTKPEISSVTTPDMKLFATYSLEKMSAKAVYKDGNIGWDGVNLTASNLVLEAGGQNIVLNSSGITSPVLDLGFTGTLAGTAEGSFTGRYLKDNLNLDVSAKTNGISLIGSANANLEKGWTGTVALEGLPKQTLYGDEPENSGTGTLKLSGAFASPKIEGDLYTFGMRLGLNASLQPLEVQLESKVNPDPNGANLGGVRSSGLIKLSADGKLSGTIDYLERASSLRISPTGTLSQPRLLMRANQGKLNASADIQLEGNDLLKDMRATLEVSDGINTGNLKLENAKLSGRIPKLNLSALQLEGYGGSLSLDANLELKKITPFELVGTANANWSKVKTPFEIPALGWQIDGTGSATFLSNNNTFAKIALDYAGTPGTAKGEFQLENDLWQGDLQLDLKGKNDKGKIQGQVTLDALGIHGKLQAQALPIESSGVSATATATISLNQDTFIASGTAQTLGGKARFEGSGGLSNLLPALEAYTHSAPDENPYTITATLDTVKLEEIAVVHQFAPNAKGRVYGGIQIVDGITSFLISVPDLTLPSTSQPSTSQDNPSQASTTSSTVAGETHVRLQLTGSAADSSIRFKGTLGSTRQPNQGDTTTVVKLDSFGDSDFQGSYDGETLSGNLDLRNAPLHALLGAAAGALPGSALVTGKARYDIPIKDPFAGEVRASFEKLEIGEGLDALSGAASAVFAKGNFELSSLRLRSKNGGEWLGSGRYSKNLVNIKLGFSNTSFTPVLDLIPSLRGLSPEASGTLALELKGDYGKPDAILNIENFKGKLAGVRLNAKQLTGKLENSKLEIRGQITTDESFNAALDTTATANLVSYTPIKLENLEARATGSLEVSPLGRIENINARAFGDSGGFKLDATASKGGAMTITGDISPRLNLRLIGNDLVFKIPDYLLSDSLIDAELSMRGDGKDYLMAGNVVVIKALGSLDQAKKAEVKTNTNIEPQTEKVRNPVFERIKFQNIKIKAPNGLKINESILKLEAGGELQLGGTLAAPELNGAVEALEINGTKGTLKLGSYNYNLSSVNASFNQVAGIYPTIRLVGKTRFNTSLRRISDPTRLENQAIEVTLVLTVTFKRDAKGDLKIKTDTQLFSTVPNDFVNPTEADLYSLITLNSSEGISIGGVSQSAINTVFTVFILNEVSRAFKEQTGLDLNIDTNLFDELLNKPETARNINVSFSIGANLTDQLRLSVNLNLGRTDFSANRILQSTIFLNYTTVDNAFSVKFALPFELQNTANNTAQFTGFNPEASFSWNFSSFASLTFGLELKDFFKVFGFKLGFTIRF